jgi:hypothetical protein
MALRDYLLGQWLPAREATVARSTHARDSKAIEHYLLPHLGDTPLRRLGAEHIRSLDSTSSSPGVVAADRSPRRPSPTSTSSSDPPSATLSTAACSKRTAWPACSHQTPRSRPSGSRRAKTWTAADKHVIPGMQEDAAAAFGQLLASIGECRLSPSSHRR